MIFLVIVTPAYTIVGHFQKYKYLLQSKARLEPNPIGSSLKSLKEDELLGMGDDREVCTKYTTKILLE